MSQNKFSVNQKVKIIIPKKAVVSTHAREFMGRVAVIKEVRKHWTGEMAAYLYLLDEKGFVIRNDIGVWIDEIVPFDKKISYIVNRPINEPGD